MTASETVFTEHILDVVLLLVGVYIVRKAYRKRGASPSVRAYFAFSVANLFYLVSNMLMIMPRHGICLTEQSAGYVVYAVYLIALAVNSYFWFCYVETAIGSNWVKSGRNRIIMALPVLVFAVLCCSTSRTGLVFTSGPNAEYGYGSMWLLQYLFCFGYLAVAMIRSAANYWLAKRRTVNDKVLMFSMCICLVAAVMQIIFTYNYMAVAITIALMLTYSELYSAEIRNMEDLKKQMRFESELEEKARIAESFSKTYNIAYVVNLADDSFEMLRMDENVIGYGINFVSFSQAADFFLSQAVYHVDRDRMCRELDYNTIRKNLANKDSYSVEYRVMVNGNSVWHEMTVTALVGDLVAIGFAIRNREILLRHLQEKETDGYYALFSVDLDTERMSVLKATRWYETGKEGDSAPFGEMVRKYAEAIDGEARAFFLEMSDMDKFKAKLADEDKYSYSYRSFFVEDRKWISVTACVIMRHDDGTPAVISLGFSIMDTMSSDRQALACRLQEALSMAKAANLAKTNFLNSMSHDIRTPMNAIVGFTALAEKRIGNREQVKDCLNKISKSSDHLLSLINDVLDMSRIESGKMVLEEKGENLLEIMDTIESIVQSNVKAKHQRFKTDVSKVTAPDVICDRLRLNQVMLNIISNSIKYTPDGGRISVSLEESESAVEGSRTYSFAVSDTGMGMSREFLEKIFDPFTRVKSTSMAGIQGSGLGMAITKNIIDMMGGSIDIQSELGQGTTIVIRFDFKTQDKSIQAVEDNAGDADMNVDLNGRTILLVEDNELNREITTAILEEFGCRIIEADDGEMAVEKMKSASEGDVDLVFMDIQMPGIDGYEATRQIRALETPVSRIPIIAMTANAFEEDRQEALNAGMNEHISKPIDVAELKRILARFL